MAFAVDVVNISKMFRLYHEKYSSLKERVVHMGRNPYEDFWALRDINLEIEEGTTVGLLGHNGSGKSTLLKCIASILQPTSGEIRTRGRLAALLELGAGFHPDLTGRENVFLNASILGLSRKETASKFDDIVAFAELEPFIDQQVKYYSSGMYVRLGFAVAVNMDPEILIVDEVLAVGDELFQLKCLDRVRQFQREGRTILFVTHSADQVRGICERAAVLDHGQLVALGPPGEAVRAYREHLLKRERYDEAAQLGDMSGDELATNMARVGPVAIDSAAPPPPKVDPRAHITAVEFRYPNSDSQPYLLPGDPLEVHIKYKATARIDDVVAVVAVYGSSGAALFTWRNDTLGGQRHTLDGVGELVFSFESIPLLDGTYPITVGLHSADGGLVYDWQEHVYKFEIMNPHYTVGIVHVRGHVERLSGEGSELGVA